MKKKRYLSLFAILIVVLACVEAIEFDVPDAELQIVVEGYITDEPGPYQVKVSEGIVLDAPSPKSDPVEGLVINLFDDEGNSELLTETSPGTYLTGGFIQGQVGHSYYISIETPDGRIYQSEPDKIEPKGEVDKIYIEYEAKTVDGLLGALPADVFNIFVDGNAGPRDQSFFRLKYTGTYEVYTNPELYERRVPTYTPFKDPFPCSGYIVVGYNEDGSLAPGGRLLKERESTCSICWVKQFEPAPQLSDNQLLQNNEYRGIKVGEVPVNNATMAIKYMVSVEQMSMTRVAFEYFKLIRAQKENASNLFQSTFGEIIGNIKGVNTEQQIIGLFWATSIDKQLLFLDKNDVPYPLTPTQILPFRCYDAYDFASTEKPAEWR
jgi:hypothetical protein